MKDKNRIITAISLLALLLFGMLTGFVTSAKAEGGETKTEEKLPVFSDGTAGIEIGISAGNNIILENEKLSFSFSPDKKGRDDLAADMHAEYEMINSSSWDAYAAVAAVKLLKVKKVSVARKDEKDFSSGESVSLDGEKLGAYIYPIGKPDALIQSSAYGNLAETMSHMEFRGYYDEAFASYGITSFTEHEERLTGKIKNIPKSNYRDYYVTAEDGEEMLCVIVANLHFDPMQTRILTIDREVNGVMKRPTEYSSEGTEFSFTCCGDTLSSFYSFKKVMISFELPEDEKLAFIESDAPIYLENGVRTVRYSSAWDRFTLVLGKRLDKNEIFEIRFEHGIWKDIFYWVCVFTTVILILSVPYIIYSAVKRRKSGIGMKLY